MMYVMFALLIATISLTRATEYHILTGTSDNAGAESNANVWIKIHGVGGVTRAIHLDNPLRDDFQQGAVDGFRAFANDVGRVTGFEIMRDDTESDGVDAKWGFDSIGVKNADDEKYLTFYFNFFLPANKWIEFPRATCVATSGQTCNTEAAACPSGTKECAENECFLKTLKCCCNA